MFDSETFSADMLSSPAKLAKAMIDEMERSDVSGVTSIKDPNNGFVMQLCSSVAIFSKFSEKIDATTAEFYAKRARTSDQLYGHLSEFDYVRLMAAPARLPFVFQMSKKLLIENSLYFDSNYNKVEIPANSYFTMGGIVYSMYYPIQILINRNTQAISAYYDTSVDNSLHTLESNQLINYREYTKDGLTLFQITFDMYQFSRKIITETVGSEQGYIKTISYEDQFYAAKVYSLANDGTWTEMAYSLSQLYYDYKTPTALIRLQPDESKLRIEIPYIYFYNNRISQTIRIELYTTKGKVNYTLSPQDVRNLTDNLDTTSSKYATILEQMPTYEIVPTRTEVVGGSDAMSFEDIRSAVVNQQLYERAAVTTPEVLESFRKAGFEGHRVIDNLTERVYYASNVLADANDIILPTFSGDILLADDALEGNPSSIIAYSDGYHTVLPTTVFKISDNGTTCTPLNDAQVTAFSRMTNAQLVTALNSGEYVRQPFHISLSTSRKFPRACLYNLLAPKIDSIVFDDENVQSAPQMSMTGGSITHLQKGAGGYVLKMIISRAPILEDTASTLLSIYLSCRSKNNELVFLPATYAGKSEDGLDIWEVAFRTSYHLSHDDYIQVIMNDIDGIEGYVDIALQQSFSLVTAFDRQVDPLIPTDSALTELLPLGERARLTTMSKQTVSVSFGDNLSNKVYSGVNVTWGNDVYDTAEDDIYYTTPKPVFQQDEEGTLNVRKNSANALEVVELYPLGSVLPDTSDIYLTLKSAVSTGGKARLVVTSVTGLLPGMQIRGLNIPVATVIESVQGEVVTLSKVALGVIPVGSEIIVTNINAAMRTVVAQSSIGTQLTVASTNGLIAGLSVKGFDIAPNTQIQSISGQTITLSKPTLQAAKASTLLTIVNTTSKGIVNVAKGSIVRDAAGVPIIVKSAQNQYRIPAILFDGRLFASQESADQQVIETIAQRLQGYADQIETIDAGLLEVSDVFYKPARTIGSAKFGVGGGQELTLPLALSFSFSVYVDAAIYQTQPLLKTMSTTIIGIVNKAIREQVICVSEITSAIKSSLGSNAVNVEGGDILGIDGLRLIAINQPGITPSIETILELGSNNVITRKPNIKINYLPKPDTSRSTVLNNL